LGIITITSDLGNKDHYVAAVKAAILSHEPAATIVDISHMVRPFDLHSAAYLIRSVWNEFPMGTVHMIGINPELTAENAHVVVHYMSHYFVGADNGIFSLIFDEEPEDVFEITLAQGDNWTFPMKGVFATAAAHLSKGGSPEFLGTRIEGLNRVMSPEAYCDGALIKGRVEYIDHYGNAYTNISKELFEAERKKRNYAVQFKSNGFAIQKISRYYTDVVEGERLAMWAGNGYLLIAINGGASDHGGGAAELFGLETGDSIRIEFYGDSNSEDDLQD
jgi:S-adenosyl-L-methionine hydrolase (adenosine-forming)